MRIKSHVIVENRVGTVIVELLEAVENFMLGIFFRFQQEKWQPQVFPDGTISSRICRNLMRSGKLLVMVWPGNNR
jgi:hypothetical protein